jgi:hypothetical protein
MIYSQLDKQKAGAVQSPIKFDQLNPLVRIQKRKILLIGRPNVKVF